MTEKKTTKEKPKEKKLIFTVGKRKRSVARATLRKGSGIVKVNSKLTELIEPEMIRLRVQEPLILAGNACKAFDIDVVVRGGGPVGQAEAARQSIARALVEAVGKNLEERYVDYDRNLLVYDPRRTEPHKPPRSSQGPRRYKQRSKR
jgi:small subunit ribosomal protein S9